MKAILRGLARTPESAQLVQGLAEEEYDTQLLMSIQSEERLPDHDRAVPESQMPKQEGGFVTIRYEAHQFKEVYLDEYTREPLPLDLVKNATIDELDYSEKKKKQGVGAG